MKKLLMVSTLVLLVLSAASQTQASPTITCVEIQEVRTPETYVDILDATNGPRGTYFVPSGANPLSNPYYRHGDADWGWTHTFNPPVDKPADVINSATLEIKAYDVDGPEIDIVSADGTTLGQLTGSDGAWSVTPLDVPVNLLQDGSLAVWLDIDSAYYSGSPFAWKVAIGSSTHTVNYETVELIEVEVPCPQQTIPEPGAILLSSVGVGVVGWLRRRRTL